jgi:hypothetical protein
LYATINYLFHEIWSVGKSFPGYEFVEIGMGSWAFEVKICVQIRLSNVLS